MTKMMAPVPEKMDSKSYSSSKKVDLPRKVPDGELDEAGVGHGFLDDFIRRFQKQRLVWRHFVKNDLLNRTFSGSPHSHQQNLGSAGVPVPRVAGPDLHDARIVARAPGRVVRPSDLKFARRSVIRRSVTAVVVSVIVWLKYGRFKPDPDQIKSLTISNFRSAHFISCEVKPRNKPVLWSSFLCFFSRFFARFRCCANPWSSRVDLQDFWEKLIALILQFDGDKVSEGRPSCIYTWQEAKKTLSEHLEFFQSRNLSRLNRRWQVENMSLGVGCSNLTHSGCQRL